MKRPIRKETAETGVAFRAGVKGLAFNDQLGPRTEIPVQSDKPQGPSERYMETIERLPGLSDPVGAYETGRALRMIGHIFDEQESPVSFAQVFLSKLGEALLYFAMRGERQPWGAEDTVFVFLETCTPAGAPREFRDHTRKVILDYARRRPVLINPTGKGHGDKRT